MKNRQSRGGIKVVMGMPKKDHFRGQTAFRHLAEMRASGIPSYREIHGAEAPGPVFAFLDASREAAILFAMVIFVFDGFQLVIEQKITLGVSFFIAWGFWKGVRSAFLSWSRLQRLHRVALEEKEEIESNRPQEREELVALYSEKGFSGPLLDKVVDVLMADQDRLLRVMLQEEMGVRLEEHPHPLVQGLFAVMGVAFSLLVLSPLAFGCSFSVVLVSVSILVGCMGGIFARLEKNDVIHAFFWNGMLAAVTLVLCKVSVF
jgi:hypothetical protein